MKRRTIAVLALCLTTAGAAAQEPAESEEKLISGMSILGNHEAPKSLVIVPWKSSELGTRLDVSRMLDAGAQPVDKEVFTRELEYYEIRSGDRD
jgi:hypothetical protein